MLRPPFRLLPNKPIECVGVSPDERLVCPIYVSGIRDNRLVMFVLVVSKEE